MSTSGAPRTQSRVPVPVEAGNVTLEEAAKRLGVSAHTLRAWACYQHRVPFYRLGRRIVFSPADLEAFLAANRVPARHEGTR